MGTDLCRRLRSPWWPAVGVATEHRAAAIRSKRIRHQTRNSGDQGSNVCSIRGRRALFVRRRTFMVLSNIQDMMLQFTLLY